MAELRGFELWTLSSRPGYSHGAVQAVAGFQLPLHGLFDLRMAISRIIRAPGAHEIDGAAAVDVQERRAFAACEELGITLGKVRGVQMPHIPPEQPFRRAGGGRRLCEGSRRASSAPVWSSDRQEMGHLTF